MSEQRALLVVIRHGESVYNAERRMQGQADPPLTARGREQAVAARGLIKGRSFDRVLSSDLARARETAELLGLEPEFEPRLREREMGAWTDRLIDEIAAEPGDPYAAWRFGELDPPGGETLA